MKDEMANYFFIKGDKRFGMMYMQYRKKPCLYIQKNNVATKVASFNNYEAAEAFMEFIADFFNVKERVEE